MKTINVLVTHAVDEASLQVMREADPGVRVTMIPYRETSEQRIFRRKGRLPALTEQPLSDELREAYKTADVLFSLDLPTNVVAIAPRLRWVQNIGAGVDHLLSQGGTGVWDAEVTITNMGGFNSRAIAEFVMAYMLTFVKRLPEYFEAQARKEWRRFPCGTLAGQTVGVIGMGKIGGEVAKLGHAFDMTVLANRRTMPEDVPTYVDRMYDASGLDDVLRDSDFVVVALPAVGDTDSIIGERELRLMKPTGVIINVARGTVMDEAAVTRALTERWIGGAALDVFEKEPLSPDSPLWDAPNTIVTPHATAVSESYGLDSARFFAQNLRRFIAGQPMQNVVDKQKGY